VCLHPVSASAIAETARKARPGRRAPALRETRFEFEAVMILLPPVLFDDEAVVALEVADRRRGGAAVHTIAFAKEVRLAVGRISETVERAGEFMARGRPNHVRRHDDDELC